MGEEEKAPAAESAAEGAAAPGSEVPGMPGGFAAPAGGGKGLFLSQTLLLIIVPAAVIVMAASIAGAYRLGKMKGLLKEGLIHKSNQFMGPVYPLEEIKTNILNSASPMGMTGAMSQADEKLLEIKISLILNDDLSIDEINKRYPQLIDSLFTIIQKKSYDELDSIPDQNKLKRQIRDELNAILSRAKIKDVYFEKFRILPLKPVEVIRWDDQKS